MKHHDQQISTGTQTALSIKRDTEPVSCYRLGKNLRDSLTLGNHATVFPAELLAIQYCVDSWLTDGRRTNRFMFGRKAFQEAQHRRQTDMEN